MFDTMKIAKRIKQARIDKNMTQMNLADAMGVSYQAVSNWERGNSLPDISKLEELCGILGMTAAALLGIEEETAPIQKALREEPMTLDELAAAAPMLPPAEVRERVESQKTRKKLRLAGIAVLAPYLDEEYLDALVEDADLEDLDGLEELAFYLSEETLDKLVGRIDPKRLKECDDLWIHLGEDTLDALVLRYAALGDVEAVESLALFAREEALDAAALRLREQYPKADLSDLYPHMGEKTLRKLAEAMLRDRDLEALGDIAPFL